MRFSRFTWTFCNSWTSRSVKEGLIDVFAIGSGDEWKRGERAELDIVADGAHALGRDPSDLFRHPRLENVKDQLLVSTILG